MTEYAGKGAGKGEYLFTGGRSATWLVTLETSVLKSKKAQIDLPYNPAIQLLHIFPKE